MAGRNFSLWKGLDKLGDPHKDDLQHRGLNLESFTMKGYFYYFLTIVIASIACAALESQVEAASPPSLFEQLDTNRDGWVSRDEMPRQRMFERLLRTSDKDGDQRLSPAELRHGLKPVKPAKSLPKKQDGNLPGADALVVLLHKINPNDDDRIEADEVPKDYRSLFGRILQLADSDHDGVLGRREMVQAGPRMARIALQVVRRRGIDVQKELAALPASARSLDSRPNHKNRTRSRQFIQRVLRKFDANGDGKISRAETPPKMAARFNRIDTNGDGLASRQELEQFAPTIARAIRKNQPASPRGKSRRKARVPVKKGKTGRKPDKKRPIRTNT